MNTAAVTLLRSLGYGAMIGGGICGLAFCVSATSFSAHIALREVVLVGGLLGAGLHQMIGKLFDTILRPVTNALSYYSKLAQLSSLQKLGLVQPVEAHRLTESLTKSYFITGIVGIARPRAAVNRRLPAPEE